MRSSLARTVISIVFGIVIMLPLQAQEEVPDGQSSRRTSISGTVIDAATQIPLAGAVVRIVDRPGGAITDSAGRFTLYDLPAGTYQIRCSYVTYETALETDIIVTNARPATVAVKMRAAPLNSQEVTVRPDYFGQGSDLITSTRVLNNEEIRRIPGGFEDVVRAISTLPGVAQVSNGRNDLLVRGGAPSENLFLIDNIESPNINHFGTQGSGGGPLSFVNLDFVQSTTFSTGGFGARYGDKISSVLNIDLRDGREDRLGGKATISASQFGLNLEGPVGADGSWLFSARRSYLDFIFRAAGFSFVPEYWDFLAKGSWRLDDKNQFSVLGIGVIDRVRFFNDDQDNVFDNSRILDNSQDQLVAGLTWKHIFSAGFVTTTLGRTVVDFQFRQTDSLLNPIFENSSTEDEYNLRSDALFLMGDLSEISFGVTAKTVGFDAAIRLVTPDTILNITPGDRFYKGGLYLQFVQTLPWGAKATVGGRLDYFSGVEEKLSPGLRLAFMQPIDPQSSITLSAGRYYQAPSYVWLVANADNRALKSIQSDIIVASIDRTLADDLRLSVEGYWKRYDDYPASVQRPFLVLANTGAGFGGADDGFASFGLEPLVSEGTGRAYGLEFLLQKKLSDIPFYGTLSLSLNNSYFTARDGVERPGNFDQRVIANLSGGYRINDDWEVGAKFRFASGRPYTPVDATGDPDFGYQVTSAYNSLRLDPSHALDVRVDRRWAFSSWNLIAYIDVQNVYNRKNPNPPLWNARENGPDSEASQIGILPSIGLSAEW